MRNSFLFLLFSVLLYAQQPNIYPILEDKIFPNTDKIKKLLRYPEYYIFMQQIDHYIQSIEKTKALGFKVIHGSNEEKKKYLSRLRALANQNDFFLATVEQMFNEAIETQNYELFVRVIDSDLLDIQRDKEKILSFYYQHSDRIIPYGLLKELIQQEHNTSNKVKYEMEKIKEMRRLDRIKQQKLQEELRQKLLEQIQ